MVMLITFVGLLNVCLGFGLAIYLGYGPPGLIEAWEALCTTTPPESAQNAAGDDGAPTYGLGTDGLDSSANHGPQGLHGPTMGAERTDELLTVGDHMA